VLGWVFSGRLWRPRLAVGLILFSVVNTTRLTLPVGRPGGPVFTIATGPNPDLAAEVGWPGYVDQVGEVKDVLQARKALARARRDSNAAQV